MYKKITVALAAAALSVSMAVPAMAQWNQTGNTWQWVENGAAVKDKWVTTVNGQYYINLDGVVSAGWINWNGNWYYGEPTGANLGNLVKNSFAKVDGKVYYFGENGAMATGTQIIGGVSYTFNADGSCTTTPSVTMPTYGSGSTAVAGGTVSGGGGSSSGGGGGSTHTVPSADTVASRLENSTVAADRLNQINGVSGASVNAEKTSDTEVSIEASATVKADADAATVLTRGVSSALSAAGIRAYDVQYVTVGPQVSGSYTAAMSAARELLKGKTVAQAQEEFGEYRNVTVTLANGVVLHIDASYNVVG